MKKYTLDEDDVLIISEINGGFKLPNQNTILMRNIWDPVVNMCKNFSHFDLWKLSKKKDCSPYLAYVSKKDYDFLVYQYALNLN